jgi:hypothetical protein
VELGVSGLIAARAPRSETCRSARKAIKFYRARYVEHRAKMGAAGQPKVAENTSRCPHYLAHLWQRKARAARRQVEDWWARQPKLSGETWRDVRLDSAINRNLIRLAICETGGINDGRPLWTHSNSTYVGALGFAWSTWRSRRWRVRPLPPADAAKASPAEQLAVGRALVREFGNYSSWPSCHRRLGLP